MHSQVELYLTQRSPRRGVCVTHFLRGIYGGGSIIRKSRWLLTSHFHIVSETVKAQKNLSGARDYDVEQTVKSWLAHAKERLDKAAKSMLTKYIFAEYKQLLKSAY